jgi:hypothetical protein
VCEFDVLQLLYRKQQLNLRKLLRELKYEKQQNNL